jgi:hypothetical protein
LQADIHYPVSKMKLGDRNIGSESEVESHASSDASVHFDSVCVICAFLEPLSGLRESFAVNESKRLVQANVELTAIGLHGLLGDKSFLNQSQSHKCSHHNRNIVTTDEALLNFPGKQ